MQAAQKENSKLQFNSNNDSDEISIKKMGISDFDNIKDFVVEQHNSLEREDFFIIEDIDTELPVILSNGIVVAIMQKDKILGLQAIDLSLKNSLTLQEILQSVYTTNGELYELGWTMVRKECRGKNYAKKLIEHVCSYLEDISEYTLVATVHPANTIALKVYMDYGMKPIFQTQYYGYDRTFLIKKVTQIK